MSNLVFFGFDSKWLFEESRAMILTNTSYIPFIFICSNCLKSQKEVKEPLSKPSSLLNYLFFGDLTTCTRFTNSAKHHNDSEKHLVPSLHTVTATEKLVCPPLEVRRLVVITETWTLLVCPPPPNFTQGSGLQTNFHWCCWQKFFHWLQLGINQPFTEQATCWMSSLSTVSRFYQLLQEVETTWNKTLP